MREREYIWYVQPLNSHTNKVFARYLPAENRCSKGQKIPDNLYSCPDRETVQHFWDSRDDLNLEFKVFSSPAGKNRSNRDAHIRECTFLFRGNYRLHKKQLKTKAAKAAPKMAEIPF
jgi:hypothetical protein